MVEFHAPAIRSALLIALQHEVGARMHVGPVDDEFAHELHVELRYALRIRQDLGNVDRNCHLEKGMKFNLFEMQRRNEYMVPKENMQLHVPDLCEGLGQAR